MTEADVKRGLRYYDRFGAWRVMAIAEGWYMVRRTGCPPTLFRVKDLVQSINNKYLSLEPIPLAREALTK